MDLPTIDLDSAVFGAFVLGAAVGWFVGFLHAVVAYMGAEARRRDAERDAPS